MAEGGYEHGQMDTRQQELTFHSFIMLSKWGSLYLAVTMLFLVLWFATDAGFLGGLVTAIVVLVVGTYVLAEKKGPKAPH
jgi:thiamine transporter ThiT